MDTRAVLIVYPHHTTSYLMINNGPKGEWRDIWSGKSLGELKQGSVEVIEDAITPK